MKTASNYLKIVFFCLTNICSSYALQSNQQLNQRNIFYQEYEALRADTEKAEAEKQQAFQKFPMHSLARAHFHLFHLHIQTFA